MATATQSATPSREDFAKMLDESFTQGSPQEGAVVKGIVVGIEKDVAVIDVGAKTEGRVALREFAGPGRQAEITEAASPTAGVFRAGSSNRVGSSASAAATARARLPGEWPPSSSAFATAR